MGTNEWLLIIVMLIGLAGTVLPFVPGMGLVFAALLIYGLATGWEVVTGGFLFIAGIVMLICFGLDYLASVIGAKKFGATKLGITGALVGTLIGMLLFNIVGMMIGAVIGIIIAELYQKKTVQQSLTAATGVLIGNAVGMAIKFCLALIIIIITIIRLG